MVARVACNSKFAWGLAQIGANVIGHFSSPPCMFFSNMAEGSQKQSKWQPDAEDIACEKLRHYQSQGKRAYLVLKPVYGDSDSVGCTMECVCEDDDDFIDYDDKLMNNVTCTCLVKAIRRDHCYVHDTNTRKNVDEEIEKRSKRIDGIDDGFI